jgi:hypothetical protein
LPAPCNNVCRRCTVAVVFPTIVLKSGEERQVIRPGQLPILGQSEIRSTRKATTRANPTQAPAIRLRRQTRFSRLPETCRGSLADPDSA